MVATSPGVADGPIGPLPPFDLNAEESVVGALLVDDTLAAELSDLVNPADFFSHRLGLIYDAALAVYRRGQPTVPVLVCEELGRRGLLEEVGGLAAISQLTTELPTVVGADHFARIVARDAGYRRLLSAAGKIANIAHRGGPDLDSVLAASHALLREAVPTKQHDWVALADLADTFGADLLRRADYPHEHPRGIPTGWPSLDRLLDGGGIIPGYTYLLCAETSVGKSTVLRSLLSNLALTGVPVGLCTLEQSLRVTYEQTVWSLAGVDHQWYEATRSQWNERDRAQLEAAIAKTRELPHYWVDDSNGITPDQLRSKLTRLHEQHGIQVCGIDYLHLMRPNKARRNPNRADELTEIATEVRDLGKELGVAIILLSQLNRDHLQDSRKASEYRPQIGDLYGSSGMEKVAFAILALNRYGYYAARGMLPEKPERDDEIEVHILKQQTGPSGTYVKLQWNGAAGQVEEYP